MQHVYNKLSVKPVATRYIIREMIPVYVLYNTCDNSCENFPVVIKIEKTSKTNINLTGNRTLRVFMINIILDPLARCSSFHFWYKDACAHNMTWSNLGRKQTFSNEFQESGKFQRLDNLIARKYH